MERNRQGNPLGLIAPALGGVLLGAVVVGTLVVTRQQSSHMSKPSVSSPVASPRASAPLPIPSVQGDAEALALYRRTLTAQVQTPLTAHLTVTESSRKTIAPIQIDMVEGTNGRYRMTYRSPQDVAGRTLINDGKTLYQYEPSRNVVIERPLPVNSETKGTVDETGKDGPNITSIPALPNVPLHITRTTSTTMIAGRPVDLLTLGSQKAQSSPLILRERRWIDRATGRSLRIERYAENGAVRFRFELSNVKVTPVQDQVVFHPDFPRTARTIRARAPHVKDVAALAANLSLPAHAGGLRIRSALSLRSLSHELFAGLSGSDPSSAQSLHSHHLLYSDGIRSVSVFVSPLPPGKTNLPLTPEGDWKSASSQENTTNVPALLTRADDKRGSVAVAWLKGGRRYVAISRMPLPHLLPIVQDLYAAR